MAEWCQLPFDIVEKIGVRLDAVEDFLAFSAVCHSWRSFFLIKKWTPRQQMPWLMLSDNENGTIRGFFSLHRDKVYELDLPEARGKRCWGGSDGWLVTMGSGDLDIHLLNVFTRARVILPARSRFQILFNETINWYQFTHKAFIIRKPNDGRKEECLVMAIYGPFKQLAFTKPGYSSWINIEQSFQYRFMDVAYVNDQIFALCSSGTLLLVNVDSQEIMQIALPPHQWTCERIYLVESAGDLLMVVKYFVFGFKDRAEPIQFEVFKLDFGSKRWRELKDLQNRTLFVGDNICFSISATKFMNCRGNSIYFVGSEVEDWWMLDEHFEYQRFGVYNVADETVETFYFGADYPSYYSCPIWLTPTIVYAQGQ